MKLVKSIMTNNPCYKAGRKINVKGLMLHSVGCSQPSAEVFIRIWNKASYSNACVHGFIDANTGVVYQTLPWNHRGWHSASGRNGAAHNTHIGVEMCEPSCITYKNGGRFTCSDTAKAKEAVRKTYTAAVELFAYLCKEYGLNPLADGVIISHSEGYKRGIASNHGDPEHLWNGLNMGYTMDGFRKDVKKAMGGTYTVETTTNKDVAENATTTTKGGDTVAVTLSVLRKGSKGRQVKSLQWLLIALGHSCGSAGADGDFGNGTLSAVKDFQRVNGLTVDGIVGQATWTALLK